MLRRDETEQLDIVGVSLALNFRPRTIERESSSRAIINVKVWLRIFMASSGHIRH